MGLDLVEFVIAIEDAFELPIPDADIEPLTTPASLIEYLAGRLSVAESGPPLVQVAFYRVRRAVAAEVGLPDRGIGTETTLSSLAPSRSPRELSHALAARLNVSPRDLTSWDPPNVLSRLGISDSPRLGAVAERLATRRPTALLAPPRTWTRAQITDTVLRILEQETGISRARIGLGDDFVRDLDMT